ncbi:argininosuccinate lyase [Desulfogranum marinum]|uniref:argininosuccinate lyase n=1 Tax=Desulfogranum marinum TaxID=453220 RepID=UPI00196545AD|nr:argininosuccinate lyase [Desulfogranum marinum]MBM9514358.1 argininosuccinate lyase [Desulfogranum marinum]
MSQQDASAKLWGGRFSEATAASVEDFSASVQYDARLYKHDIMGSKAHAKMLAKQGLISEEEYTSMVTGLDEIERDIASGRFEFKPELEDVHMNIEKALTDRIGAAGAKLHTARSRNDQVNLDFRMYLRDEVAELDRLLENGQRAFVRQGRKYLGTIMPGYTHMQRAQPVLLSHHLLAYFEMLKRDRERLQSCLKRINVLPLGSAALAGTGLPVDRDFVAQELGFPEVSANSMDTSGDRDFALELLFCLNLIQMHLSRLAEELVYWSSKEFDFVRIGDRYCTGSSIMPQKKNPDIPELIRGKSGRVTGALVSLLVTVKGLPLTYNRDLQEDKEPVFDALDTVKASLSITAELLDNTEFNVERLQAATYGGFMTATDLADYLVCKNVPFRQAHGIVGKVVAHCQERDIELIDLNLAELKQFSEHLEADVFDVLSVEGSVNSRVSTGGTALVRVTEALEQAEIYLG